MFKDPASSPGVIPEISHNTSPIDPAGPVYYQNRA